MKRIIAATMLAAAVTGGVGSEWIKFGTQPQVQAEATCNQLTGEGCTQEGQPWRFTTP